MLTAWRYGRYHVCVLGGFAGAGHLAKEATELLCLERLLPKIQDSTIIIVRTPQSTGYGSSEHASCSGLALQTPPKEPS